MDLSTVGSISAYVRSIKTSNNVHDTFQKGFSDKKSARDTAAFSAKARAAARADSYSVTAKELEDRISELVEKAEQQNAQNAAENTVRNTASKTSSAKNATSAESENESKSISEMIEEQMEKIDSLFAPKEYDKSNDNMLGTIKAKMRSGLTLSPSEQQYLADKDPDTYSVFKATESARKIYRCSLNACRTKDEVNSMRLSNALSALSAYKKAVRNGGDGSAAAGLNAALDREIRSFTSSSNYSRLPTAAECNKFDRDLAKAKRNEREKRLAEKRKLEARRKRTLAARKKAAKRVKYKKTPGDGKMTVAQVMSSPTARKVLASRAKRNCGDYVYVSDYKSTRGLYSKV